MNIKYSWAQLIGCILIFSLTASILLIDYMWVHHLPFEWNYTRWHPYSIVLVICIIVVVVAKVLLVCRKVNGIKKVPLSWKGKLMKLIFNSGSGNWIDICFILSFFLYIAWLPDSCSDFIKEDKSPFRFFLYCGGLALLVFIKPVVYKDDEPVSADERTLLVTGISHIRNKPYISIEPIIHPLQSYKNIKKIVVLLTDDVQIQKGCLLLDLEKDETKKDIYRKYKYGMLSLYCSHYANVEGKKVEEIEAKLKMALTESEKEEVLKDYSLSFELSVEKDFLLKFQIENLLRNFIQQCAKAYYGREIEDVEFTDPVDYNNFNRCNETCYDKLVSLSNKGYKDRNIVVSITSGTASLSAALALNAIKGEREMIFINQKDKTLVKANPNVMMVQFNELWTEKTEQE